MEPLYWLVERLTVTGFWLLRWDVRVAGAEHIPAHGPAVIATNHVSYLDELFSGYAALQRGRRIRFVAKKELFDARLLGMVMRRLGQIPVDRSGRPEEAVRAAVECLHRGELVGMFPEGTISRSFVPLPGKTGAVRMAMAAGVPLIPGAVWGGQRCITKGHKPQLIRHLVVTCDFGPPVPYEPDDDPHEVSDRLMDTIGEMVDKAQRSYPDEPAGPDDAWWLPAHLGGTAPTPDEARDLARGEAAERARRRRQRRQRDGRRRRGSGRGAAGAERGADERGAAGPGGAERGADTPDGGA